MVPLSDMRAGSIQILEIGISSLGMSQEGCLRDGGEVQTRHARMLVLEISASRLEALSWRAITEHFGSRT
jgi:hypothetical protein